MTTSILVREQAMSEVRTYDIDFADDLRTGVTLASVTATHIPPSGSSTTPVIGTISGSIVPVTLGVLSVTGLHLLRVVGTLSDSDKSTVELRIPVNY